MSAMIDCHYWLLWEDEMKAVLVSVLLAHLLLFSGLFAGGCDTPAAPEEEEIETEEETGSIDNASDLHSACVELSELCDLCS